MKTNFVLLLINMLKSKQKRETNQVLLYQLNLLILGILRFQYVYKNDNFSIEKAKRLWRGKHFVQIPRLLHQAA